ncbi:MAG TPA: pYEATS domain-containing protein [Puia sp.]
MDAPNITSKRWDIRTLELKPDPMWGIPAHFLSVLVGQGLIGPNTLQTPRISFREFQNIVKVLHENGYDTGNIAAAVEKWAGEKSFSVNTGFPVTFNEKWILVAGTWSQRIESDIVEFCRSLGKTLASGGYGLMTGDGQGVDFQVSLAFAQELRDKGIDPNSRLQMVLMPKQSARHEYGQKVYTEGNDHWCHYTMGEASAVVTIGGKGGTYGLMSYARQYKVPFIAIPGTGGDSRDILKQLTPDEQNYNLERKLSPGVRWDRAESFLDPLFTLLGDLKPKHPDLETFKQQVESAYRARPINDPVDIQKGRWGDRYANLDKVLEASVSRSQNPGFYTLEISVRAKVNPLAKGHVALFLHNSFPNEIEYVEMIGGKASLTVEAYEAFTVGAFLDDGTTLELDLNTWTGYPKDFYIQPPDKKFVKEVEALYRKRPPKWAGDPQNERWGGRSNDGKYKLEAEVTPALSPREFNTRLTVSSISPSNPLRGQVAFFLYDGFPKEIEYIKVRENKAWITLNSTAPFTVGAYTQDGSMLELDLKEFFPKPSPSGNNSNDRTLPA